MDAPLRRSADDPRRFWEKVEKTDFCWVWVAHRDRGGYGRFMVNGLPLLAHRVSFEMARGPIPGGLYVDHMCHNTACVNPSHLRLATAALNGQNLAGARRDSSSGIRGVIRRNSKWSAEVQLRKERFYLGRFATPEEAEAAVSAWRREHMPYSLMDRKTS